MTIERYDHITMLKNRKAAVDVASNGHKFGLILGSLGRQGSPKILKVSMKCGILLLVALD